MRAQQDYDPRDAEIAQLKAVLGQVLTLCQDTFKTARHNRPLIDFILDVRNRVAPRAGRR